MIDITHPDHIANAEFDRLLVARRETQAYWDARPQQHAEHAENLKRLGLHNALANHMTYTPRPARPKERKL